MTIPSWALTLFYWLHMLATVVWLGGLAAIILLVHPAARNLNDPERQLLLESAQRRLEPVGWFSLVLLTGTGLMQMSASPRYEGFLTINNPWTMAILLKHIVFLGMIGINAYQTWVSLPELNRAALKQSLGKTSSSQVTVLQKRNFLLLRANLILGIVILVLTAWARASV